MRYNFKTKKHRANSVAALLSNWKNVESAVKSATEAEGSAARENAKYVDSIQGRLDKLTTTWQSFANTFMSSDFLKGAVSALTGLVEIIEKLVKTLGTVGTIGLGAGIFGLFKSKGLFKGILGDIGSFVSLVPDAIKSSGTLGGKIKNLGSLAGQAGGSIASKFTGSLSGMIGGIGLAIAAIGLIVNAYKNYKEEISAARQETIKASDEFLDAAGSFEQAYIKYSGRTDLTAEEESELEAAIQGTVDALGDKSSALQNAVNSSNDYLTSLENIKKAELEAANRAAKEKRDNAKLELQDTVKGWSSIDGSEVDVKIGVARGRETLDTEAAKIAEKIGAKYYKKHAANANSMYYQYSLILDPNASIDEIVDYYHTLEKIKAEYVNKGLTGTSEYEAVVKSIDKMSEAVKVYEDGLYDAAKAQYQLTNGIPKTTEAYLKMRESVLNEVGGTIDTRKAIANTLDSEYGQIFDLTTSDVQARKLIGVLDKYGDNEAAQMETFLNMRTAVNNNECTVGDYMSQFDDINKMTEDWSDEEKNELNTSFGIDVDTIKSQYDEVVKSYMRTFDAESGNLTGIQENFEKNFLDGLSATELAAVFNLKTEIDWQSDSFDEILKQIEEEAALIEAISFSVNIELEAEKLENLSTAISESVSGAGLSTESISLVEDMFGDLDGYDQSALFERTANGIRLNSDELRKLNDEYKKTNVDGLNDKVDALGERYLQAREELSDLTYGTEEYNDKARELSDIEAQINAAEKLAAQYRGLASAYNEWQRVESSGSQRDMYENMIEGFENVGDEISRGWIDDGTIEFLELIKGEKATIIDANGVAKEIDIATASAKELKQVWKDLDKNIEHTSYSVRDFFTVDDEGNSTADGVYNFLDAIGQMEEEKFGGKDVVKRDKKGKIIAFDFQIAGGDKAIAEALGVSEELVQIMKRAADDAGFVVSMDGTYQQLDVLKKKAQEAANELKNTFKKTEFEFDLNTSNKDSVLKQYQEALKIWEEFKKNKNKDGTVNMDVKGAEEAFTLVSTLQSMVDKLGEPVYMELNASQVEKDMQTPLSKLQEYERLTQTENQLKLKGTDTTEIDNAQKEILDYFENLKTNQPEIAAKLGIEKLTKEEIQEKIESGELEIPATVDLQVEMNDTLKDMVNVALYNAGLIDKEELEKRVDIKVYADEIDTSNVEEKTEDAVENNGEIKTETKQNVQIIADVLGVEDVDDLSSKLKGLDDKTIQAIAEVLGNTDVEKLQQTLALIEPKKVQAIAEAIGQGDVDALKTAISQLDPKTVQAIAEAFGYSDVNELIGVIDNLDPKTVQAVAQALGLTDVNTLQSAVNNMHGNTVDAKVNTDGQASKIDTLQTKINSLKGKIVNVGVQIAAGGKKKAAQRTGADPAGNDSDVNGTAHVNGTVGRAYKQGSWGTKNSGTALVGELGREVLVRDGRYYTIGDNGAEFIHYKKGDIIFNHVQSEELFKNGKVTSGGGRARAFVSGTAFDEGTGGGEYGGLAVGSNSGDNDKFEEVLDWIETILDRAERAIDKYEKQANNVYKTWSSRENALDKQILAIEKEINLQTKAKDYYDGKLDTFDWGSYGNGYVSKIEDGTIAMEEITDENLSKKIKEYQDLYEKYLDADETIIQLEEDRLAAYEEHFNQVQDKYDGILQGFDHTETMLNEYISQAEAKGHIVSKNYYEALKTNKQSEINKLIEEQGLLIAKRNEAEANGIDKNSQAWYDMCAEIDGVTQAIEEGTTALIEYDNAMRDIDWEVFDLIQERISDVTEEANFLIELMSNRDLFDDNGKFTEQGVSTIGLHAQNYNVAMYQSDEYAKEIAELDKQLANGYDGALYERRQELIELQRESILASEDEKNAIRDLVEEGINLELDALQELIDKKNEELESEKDLYEYSKKVKEQTSEIASLEKQIAAYSGDNSEEAKAKVQELKVSLEEAKTNLEETEYDKYLSDTQQMLDTLYDEYELILNQRLDNVDALLSDMITEINDSATTISSTLSTEATNVGTTLSEAMKGIWENDGVAKSVIAEYGAGFQGKQTTTNLTLDAIKGYVNTLVGKSDKEANAKVTANKTTTSAKKNPTTTSNIKNPTTTKKVSSTGDGKAKIGDKVTFLSGKYYYDSQGVNPAGSKNHGKQVYITNINTKSWATHPYHISTGKKLGSGDLGWLKLNQISGYATGKKNFLDNEIAWTQENGKEFIVRPSDGAILTPIAKGDSVLNAQASGNIWDMANSPAEFIKDNLNLGVTNVPNSSNVSNSYSQHIDNVVFRMDNVKNYEEMLYALRDDKRFEKLVTAMTIDQVAGKSSLTKGKSIR